MGPNGAENHLSMGDIVNPGDRHVRVLPANQIHLFWDGNKKGALIGRNLVEGVSGWGDSVHESLRDLADNLVREGVWIEVTNRTEWQFRKIGDDEPPFPD